MRSSIVIILLLALVIGGYILYEGRKEAFASVAAPLSTPSPNLGQAYQFRLGKRELVDAVAGSAVA
jgi:hypothetical protein